jgi:hypothetical protein
MTHISLLIGLTCALSAGAADYDWTRVDQAMGSQTRARDARGARSGERQARFLIGGCVVHDPKGFRRSSAR